MKFSFDRKAWVASFSLATSLAAFVGTDLFARRVSETVQRDARGFLAADYRVQAWRPFAPEILSFFRDDLTQGRAALRTDFLATLEITSSETPLNVNVAAIEGPYPFYGRWRTEPAGLTPNSLAGRRLLADRSLEARGVHVGDKVKLGATTFTIAGWILEEPQTVASAFSAGPRVVVHGQDLEGTGLLGLGARAFRQLLVKSDVPRAEFTKRFRDKVPDPHWRLVTPDRAQRQVDQILGRIRGFLSFVLLAGLFLGGAGVFSVFRSKFILELPTLLTLRCLGMTARTLILRSFAESSVVGVASLAGGAALGVLFESVVRRAITQHYGVDLAPVGFGVSVAKAAAVALVLVAIAVLLPLREILRVPVQAAFRDAEARSKGLGRSDAFILAATAIAISFGVAGDLKLAVSFLASLFGAGLLVGLIAWPVFRWASRDTTSSGAVAFVGRHARLSFGRQPGASVLLIATLGITVFLASGIAFVASALRGQADISARVGVPNLYVMGLVEEDRAFVRDLVGTGVEFVPMAQARLQSIRNEAIQDTADLGNAEAANAQGDEVDRFYRTREYFVTRRASLSVGEAVVSGAADVFGPPQKDVVRASFESSFAERLGVKPGDRFTFELAGVPLAAEVRSLRRVDWFNLRPNFFIVLNETDLADAPFGYVATARVPQPKVAEIQKVLAQKLPSASVIDGESLARRLGGVLNQLSSSVVAVGAFAGASCLFVLLGLLLSRREQKLRELSLFRALGATNAKLMVLVSLESLWAGLLASAAGLGAGAVLSFGLCRFFLEIPWEVPSPVLTLTLLTAGPLLLGFGGAFLARALLQVPAAGLFRDADEA